MANTICDDRMKMRLKAESQAQQVNSPPAHHSDEQDHTDQGYEEALRDKDH